MSKSMLRPGMCYWTCSWARCRHASGCAMTALVSTPARVAEQVASVKRGYGLQGLQERLELVRGQMSITSDTRTGTEIIVIVPKHLGQLAAT